MTNFAVMNGNIVTNIISADNKSDAELATNAICIEFTNENPASIDGTYDFEINIFKPKENTNA